MRGGWKWAAVVLTLLSVLAAVGNMAISSSESSHEIKDALKLGTILDAGLAAIGITLAVALHFSGRRSKKEQLRLTAVEVISPGLIVTGPLAIANGAAWWSATENIAPIVYGVLQIALGYYLLRNPGFLARVGGVPAGGYSELRRTGDVKSRQMMIAMIGSTQIPLVLGILMTLSGLALLQSTNGFTFDTILGSTLVGLGVIFMFVASFAVWRHLCDPNEPYFADAGVAIAVFVAVAFLFGAAMTFVGIGNMPPLNSDGPLGFAVALVVFGLILVTESVLIYRRGFKQDVGLKRHP